MTTPNLELLVQRIAGRDEEAFVDLYDATAPHLFGLAIRLLREPDLAMDVATSCYGEVWRTAPGFDPVRQSARDWMTAILRTLAASYVRLDASPARAACVHGPTRRRAAPRPDVSDAPSGSRRDGPSRCAARRRRSR